jgi:trans-aconitate methyltransferase
MPSTTHDWNPADYARHSQGQERWARELLGLLDLKPHEHVLDLGCGDGRITAQIARMVPQGNVTGVDLSPDMVEHACQHYPATEFTNLSFQCANAIDLPFHHEFDVVYSSAVLHWVRDQRKALQCISRALKPGGRSVLQMGGKGNGADVIAAFQNCLQMSRWENLRVPVDSPYQFSGTEEFRAWMEEASLIADSMELLEKDMVHDSTEAFTGWLRTAWLPYAESVSIGMRSELLSDVTREFLKNHPTDEEGCLHVNMIRLQVLAHKAS